MTLKEFARRVNRSPQHEIHQPDGTTTQEPVQMPANPTEE